MKDIMGLMGKVKEMQSKMQEMQEGLSSLEITGQAGGGLVKVTLNGKGTLTATDIDHSLLKGEEKEILEDLIVAAHADAKGRLEQLVAEEMKSITGGLPLPPGFQLPF